MGQGFECELTKIDLIESHGTLDRRVEQEYWRVGLVSTLGPVQSLPMRLARCGWN